MKRDAIRVLQVVEGLNQGMGATTVALNYQQYMEPERVVFDYMIHGVPDADLRRQVEEKGSRIFQMPALSGRNIPEYRSRLKAFFRQHPEYRIVHGHLPNAGAFYLSAAKSAGVPFRILHSHNSAGADSALKQARNSLLNHRAVKCANIYFACSQKAADYLYGVNPDREVVLVRNAIHTQKYAYRKAARTQMRRQLGVEDRFVVGHVGRFCRQKNHLFLLEVFQQVAKQVENATLLLVGDGELREETERRARELGVESQVIFAGVQDKVQYFLQAMDIFALPSFFEGLPLVGLEAQASGLPCIFSDEITREAQVTGHVAFLPLASGAEAWSEEICLFKNGYQRVDCTPQLREAGYEISVEADKLARYYENLTASR